MTAITKHPDAGEGRTLRTVRFAAIAFAPCILLPAAALSAEESKTEKIGPWEIEATFKGDNFDRCSINRSLRDDIEARFVRTSQAFSLELQSPNWKLDDGKRYPVTMSLGQLSIDTEVAAEPSSVSAEIKDEKFEAALRSEKALDVVGAGATIRVPLDKSKAAFDRLQKCVEKNDRTVQSNPFVAPARQP